MKRLKITKFGPIEEVDLEIGDMTVLVGPQATGKSLFLQFLNLLLDSASIIKTLRSFGFVLNNEKELLEHYLGFDMAKSWNDETEIALDGKVIDIHGLLRRKPRAVENTAFYIPAQRVLIMEEGWPRPFLNLSSYPYIVRDFSERLRTIMEASLGKGALFPQEGKLKKVITDKIQEGIFRDSTIKLETEFKKRLVLEVNGTGKMQLPISFWSAGQREFMPLLLGLYYLIPASKVSQKGQIQTVIIEELEMGLHPNAIYGVMFAILELLHRGYKVVISTHSLHVVEMIWAIEEIRKSGIKQNDRLKAFYKLFNLESPRIDVRKMAQNCLEKQYKVFYFEPGKKNGFTSARDITSLDPGEEDPGISGWGGLSDFSSRIVDVVSGLHEIS